MANSDGTRVSADEAKRRNIEQDDDSNPGILDEDNVFEVEKIVGRTKVDGKALYRVRWLGYGPQSDTWEPYENLLTCKDLVEEYVEREQKKKKRSPGEKSVKKKRINLNESKEDEELSAGNYSSKELEGSKQLKDTFWKDLEEGRINVFAEDMYSKVKGRSARHQNVSDDQSKKQRKAKTKHPYDGNSSDTSLIDGSKGKHRSQKTLRKSRKRVLVISSSSDASEEENAEGQETNTGSEETSVEEMNDSMSFGETKQNAAETSTSEHAANVKTSIDGESDATMSIDLLKSTLGNSTDDNDPNNNNSNNNNNDNNNNDDDNNNNTAITINNNFNNNIDDHNEESLTQDRNNNDNSEFSSDKDNQKQVQIHKEESTEILKDLPQEEFVNNKINATHKEKNTPAPDSSGQYSFEFSRYNPEDWIKKEAYDSRRIELTNSQFRHAVKRGDYELLRRALNGPHRCNLEQADINGMTLLMIAALCGFDDIVELLVIHGANINAVQRNGSTALMFASEFGHICCVAVLLGLGAHVDIQQHSGETSLMKACKKGYRQIVQLLLEYGANFAMVTNSDTTALKLAKLYDHPAIESLLIDHISRVTAAFEAQVNVTLNNTAHIVHALFPLHCFSLNEGNAFKINFNYQLQPPQAGVGMLLFIAHARITPQEVKCRFYGACAVISVFLNGVRQLSLTEEANFVLSFSPLRNGKNELLINTVPAVSSKAKLLVCAYKAQLNGNR